MVQHVILVTVLVVVLVLVTAEQLRRISVYCLQSPFVWIQLLLIEIMD